MGFYEIPVVAFSVSPLLESTVTVSYQLPAMANREVYMDHVRQNFWKEMVHKEELLRIDWHLKYSKNFINDTQRAASASSRRVGPAVAARQRRSGAIIPRPNSAAAKMRALIAEDEAERQAANRERMMASSSPSDVMDDSLRSLSSSSLMSSSSSSSNSSDDFTLPEAMRPPSVATRNLLFDGLSHEGRGRYAYLRRRKQTGPEVRYEYPLTNTLEYGWKINDTMGKYKPPAHGRGSIVRDSFYRNHGVF